VVLQDFDGCHQEMSLCHITMTISESKWVIAMLHRLISWWQPPKFCKIMRTSYISLIMYERLCVVIIFLLITTWNSNTNKLMIFFITKILEMMSFFSEISWVRVALVWDIFGQNSSDSWKWSVNLSDSKLYIDAKIQSFWEKNHFTWYIYTWHNLTILR
jgi:hypothetical protein